MIKHLLLFLIKIYQKAISPMLPARCRYYPTCSHYGRQALMWYGVRRGLPLAVRRVCSCHPWGGSGIDFVPVPMHRYRYDLADDALLIGQTVFLDKFSYAARLNHLMKSG
ncbi:membrane protein insertion efficiency factor YidD [Moraxella bovoculi]|uniref:Putative membrane protein insertion efficiency factor n=1 Tax=Moraxella bovoculi 237 TaxID=743974 RepID=A0A066UMJ7_9GAMM|nr:membrane protein insertion efficiency factor YidD [Moraxella bovoculi]AKG16162.2 membrane protein insertion efficiency factor YidD [Moraxella bovoculi]AKG17869.1 membrane protein insertion efficiency factor YidD [Moraxella bovoculi]KDN25438.1 hypothetical protein MBO_03632 [Moraxella bovoculi 237]